jgi:hypothetical protein
VDAVSNAIYDVMAERARQVMEEGWTPEHDDQHTEGSMAIAGACYALHDAQRDHPHMPVIVPKLWNLTGWARSWFKPKDYRRNLVRAAALIVAEIERIDRAEERKKT